MLEQSVLDSLHPLPTTYCMLSTAKDPEEALISLFSRCFKDDFSALLQRDDRTICARASDINEPLSSEGPACPHLLRSRIQL